MEGKQRKQLSLNHCTVVYTYRHILHAQKDKLISFYGSTSRATLCWHRMVNKQSTHMVVFVPERSTQLRAVVTSHFQSGYCSTNLCITVYIVFFWKPDTSFWGILFIIILFLNNHHFLIRALHSYWISVCIKGKMCSLYEFLISGAQQTQEIKEEFSTFNRIQTSFFIQFISVHVYSNWCVCSLFVAFLIYRVHNVMQYHVQTRR